MNPADRLRNTGCNGASPIDLLAVGLARREEDVSEELARSILKKKGNIRRMGDLSPQELRDEVGLEPFEALRFQAAVEIGRRIGGAGKGEAYAVDGHADIAELFAYLKHEKKEHFCAVFLDAKNMVIRTATIHIGTQTSSIVAPADVFREALREGAVSVVVAHNHPSGDPTPSAEDIIVTDRLVELGRLLNIPVLDHVVIGERKSVSFRERGLIG
jgi:DNA repair protein RadC